MLPRILLLYIPFGTKFSLVIYGKLEGEKLYTTTQRDTITFVIITI